MTIDGKPRDGSASVEGISIDGASVPCETHIGQPGPARRGRSDASGNRHKDDELSLAAAERQIAAFFALE